MQLKDASRTPAVLGIDAKVFAIMFPTIFFINLYTVLFDISIFTLFVVLKVKGLGISYAYRKLRNKIRGGNISSRPWWFAKKWRNK